MEICLWIIWKEFICFVTGSKKVRECVICMAEFQVGDALRFLPCMHTYHMTCIDDWLMRSLTCPSCLEPVDAALLTSYETNWQPVPLHRIVKTVIWTDLFYFIIFWDVWYESSCDIQLAEWIGILFVLFYQSLQNNTLFLSELLKNMRIFDIFEKMVV